MLFANDLAQKSWVRSAIRDRRGGCPKKIGDGATRPGDDRPLLTLRVFPPNGAWLRESPSKLSPLLTPLKLPQLDVKMRGEDGEDINDVEEVNGGGGGGGKS